MDFEEFYRSLRGKERDEFADRAGTTRAYIESHLLAPVERRKVPRRPLLESLAEATDGKCSVSDLLSYFYSVAA